MTLEAARRARALVARALTVLVLALLGITFASVRGTSGYELVRASDGAQPPPGVSADLARIDPTERVRIVLQQVSRGTAGRIVPVLGSRDAYTTQATQKDRGFKSFALAGQAALFALFGAVVLWFGRDRISFWLGTSCIALAPELDTLYGFVPEWWALGCIVAADLLTFIAIYALYAMADAVLVKALAQGDPLRRALRPLQIAVVAILAVGATTDMASYALPIGFGENLPDWLANVENGAADVAWTLVFCALPVTLLGLAAWRAAEPLDILRSRVMFVATALGVSGLAISIGRELASGGSPQFETLWFSLLLIPIGFSVAIRSYGIIDLQLVVSRILVFTAMTLAIGLAIGNLEELAKSKAEELMESKDDGSRKEFAFALQILTGAIIVAGFGQVHHRIEGLTERLVYRRRNLGIAAIRRFTSHPETTFADTNELAQRVTALLVDSLSVPGCAFYLRIDDEFRLAASAGTIGWRRTIAERDVAIASCEEELEPARLAGLTGSAFGDDGRVVPIVATRRVIGALAMAPRKADGDLDEEESEAVEDVARYAAEQILALRLRTASTFVSEVARGRLAGPRARRRAAALAFAVKPRVDAWLQLDNTTKD